MSADTLFHIADLAIQGIVALAVIPIALRLKEVLKYYPPHRHINGNVEYAPGFDPGKKEKLVG